MRIPVFSTGDITIGSIDKEWLKNNNPLIKSSTGESGARIPAVAVAYKPDILYDDGEIIVPGDSFFLMYRFDLSHFRGEKVPIEIIPYERDSDMAWVLVEYTRCFKHRDKVLSEIFDEIVGSRPLFLSEYRRVRIEELVNTMWSDTESPLFRKISLTPGDDGEITWSGAHNSLRKHLFFDAASPFVERFTFEQQAKILISSLTVAKSISGFKDVLCAQLGFDAVMIAIEAALQKVRDVMYFDEIYNYTKESILVLGEIDWKEKDRYRGVSGRSTLFEDIREHSDRFHDKHSSHS